MKMEDMANKTAGAGRSGLVYYDSAVPWVRLGFAVVPTRGGGNKAPAEKFGPYCPATDDPDEHVESYTALDLERMAQRCKRDANPLLILDSGSMGVRLVVIDIDDMKAYDWAIQEFGDTPLRVSTGREGGGVHLYYRAPAGVHLAQCLGGFGPPELFDAETGRTPIDLKAKRAYVVAPGAVHKSGAVYECSVPVETLTIPWMLDNVPEFKADVFEAHKATTTALKASGKKRVLKRGKRLTAPQAPRQYVPKDRKSVYLERIKDEPLTAWCLENPKKVGLKEWWGLASNLAAAFGAPGETLFHEISEKDPDRYDRAGCSKTYQNWVNRIYVLKEGYPTTYEHLVRDGFAGETPERGKAPAVVMRWMADMRFPSVRSASEGKPMVPRVVLQNTEALLERYCLRMRYNELSKDIELVRVQGEPMMPVRGHDELTPGVGEAIRGNYMDAVFMELAARHDYKIRLDTWIMHQGILAKNNSYHPMREWVESKPWDGVDRSGEFYGTVTLSGKADAGLAKALLRRWMISATAALYKQEGVKAEGVLVLQGVQGCGKTTWISRLAPEGVATGLLLDPANKDSVMQNTSNWIVELGELDATFRKSDIARLKSFLSQEVDNLRVPYARKAVALPRQTVFAASVNEDTFLVDKTGNRRYWTIPVAACDGFHDVDMQQVWAQVAAAYERGEQWWLTREEEQRLAAMNEVFQEVDVIMDALKELFEVDGDGWTKQSFITAQVKDHTGVSWSKGRSNEVSAALRKWSSDPAGPAKLRVRGNNGWTLVLRDDD